MAQTKYKFKVGDRVILCQGNAIMPNELASQIGQVFTVKHIHPSLPYPYELEQIHGEDTCVAEDEIRCGYVKSEDILNEYSID